MEVVCVVKQIRSRFVVVPSIDSEFFALLGEVTSHDVPLETLHVAESERTALDDVAEVEVAVVFARLSVQDFNLAIVVNAVEFAVLVSEIANLSSIVAFLSGITSLLREVPNFLRSKIA